MLPPAGPPQTSLSDASRGFAGRFTPTFSLYEALCAASLLLLPLLTVALLSQLSRKPVPHAPRANRSTRLPACRARPAGAIPGLHSTRTSLSATSQPQKPPIYEPQPPRPRRVQTAKQAPPHTETRRAGGGVQRTGQPPNSVYMNTQTWLLKHEK